MAAPSAKLTSHVIDPGSEIDRMTFGQVCESAAREIIKANPDHRASRIDLYRAVLHGGRTVYVRVKLTIPFLAIVE